MTVKDWGKQEGHKDSEVTSPLLRSSLKDFGGSFGKLLQCTIIAWGKASPNSKGIKLRQWNSHVIMQ